MIWKFEMIMTIDIHFQCQELGVLGYNISRKNMFWKSLFEVKIVQCNWDFFSSSNGR